MMALSVSSSFHHFSSASPLLLFGIMMIASSYGGMMIAEAMRYVPGTSSSSFPLLPYPSFLTLIPFFS